MSTCTHCGTRITSYYDRWIHLPPNAPAGQAHEATLGHTAQPRPRQATKEAP